MKLVDANVLLHAVNRDAADHLTARGWLDSALSGGAPVGFAWLALIAFVRLSTRPGIFARPLTAGNLANDAHLAALALEHRATIVTFDADFDRFPGVRWQRPVG